MFSTGPNQNRPPVSRLLVIAAVIVALASLDARADPSSVKIAAAPLVSPTAANTYYGSATTHTYGTFGYGTGSANPRPPEIVELARALKSDPDLIYEYVRNTIKVNFSYGLQKGALGAIIDHSGTPFDQAQLFVELMRQAGYTANYRLGTITLTAQQFTDWTGLTNAKATCQFLAAGGIPAAVNGSSDASCNYSGNVSSVEVGHIWVEATIGGQSYLFDPSYKPHTWTTGINLFTAMSYTAGNAFSQVTGGSFAQGTEGVFSVGWIKQLGAVGLKALSQNLLNHLRTNLPLAEMEDVIGGGTINRVTVPTGGFRITSLPHSSQVISTWAGDIPNQYRTYISISANDPSAGGATVAQATLAADEVYGRRIRIETNWNWATASLTDNTLWSTGGFKIWLDVDGVQMTTPYSTTISQVTNRFKRQLSVGLSAQHPYAANGGQYADHAITGTISVTTPVSIVHGWGEVSQALAAKWNTELADDRPQPRQNGAKVCGSGHQALASTGCTGEMPPPSADFMRDKMAATWLGQFSRMLDLNARVASAKAQHHHSIGFAYSDQWSAVVEGTQDGACSGQGCIWGVPDEFNTLDVSSAFSLTHSTADAIARRAAVHTAATLGAALEGDVALQLLNTPQVASTASRFTWGNMDSSNPSAAAEGNFHGGLEWFPSMPTYTEDAQPRRYYTLNSSFQAEQMDGLVTYFGRTTNHHDPASIYQPWKDAVTDRIAEYASAGFSVVASSEAYAGPGPIYGRKIFFDFSGPPSTWSNYREQQKTRGGAFVAVKNDASGDPTEIAHVVNNLSGQRKGGGAGGSSAELWTFNAAAVASSLKTRFESKSNVLSVDLRTGRVGYSTQPLVTAGNGAMPFQLSSQLVYAGPGAQEPSLWSPTGNLSTTTFPTPFRGFTHNWDIRLGVVTDAFEAMGASSTLAATTSIATMVVMQDLYRSGATSLAPQAWSTALVAGPMAFRTWHKYNNHNVINISQGGSTRRFVKLVDGTFAPPKGDTATLTQNNAVRLSLGLCPETMTVEGTNYLIAASTQYAYYEADGGSPPAVTFDLKNANGDIQKFGRWDYFWGECGVKRSVGGWVLKEWSFPHGPKLNFTHWEGGKTKTVTNTAANPHSLGFDQSLVQAPGTPETGSIIIQGDYNYHIPGRIYDENYNRIITLAVNPINKITHVDGGVTRFEYCPAVARSSTQRPLPFAHLCKVYDPISATNAAIQYTYDSTGKIKEIRDAVAIATPANRGPYKFYIADGARGEREDPMTPTAGRYAVYYDEMGRATRHIDELGRIVISEYDARDRLTKRIYPEGDEERFTYDLNNNVTEFRRKAKPSSGLADIIVQATWDQTWNKPLAITNPLGKTTTLTYYAAGQAGAGLVKDVKRPAIGGVQPTYAFTYAANTGLLTQETAPIGTSTAVITTTHTHDGYGNKTQTIFDQGSGKLNLTTQWQYNLYGDINRVRDPRGYITEYSYYNGAGAMSTSAGATRRSAETKSSSNTATTIGGAVTGWLTIARNVYDINGRVIRQEMPQSISGTTYNWTSPIAVATTTYSPTGKALTVKDAANDTTTTEYDALDRPLIVTDPINRKVKTIYDAAGQVTQLIRAFGSALQQTYATTTYSPNGQVLTVTDARGYITKNEYDGYDRPVKLLFPDGTPANDNDNLYEQYTYDLASRKLTSRTRANQALTYGYDDLDRAISRTGGAMPDRTFAYDLAGRGASVKDMNGAATVAETQYTYDTAGRLTRERRNDWSQNVDYVLDANGNRTGLKWPDAYQATYTYDGLNRVTQVAVPSVTLRTYAYDHLARRSGEVAMPGANQTATTYAFETDSDLSGITHNYPGATLDLAFTHTYSAAGQLLTKTTSEALNRHAEASAVGTQAYSTANPLNQYPGVTPIGGALNTLAYDLNGNMTGDGSSTFTYDAANRLLSIAGLVTASYGYDALDRRMSKTTGGATTRFLHAGADEIAEYTSAGALIRRYVPGPGVDERAAMIDSGSASPPATSVKYPHTDRQGSVMAVTSSTGAVSERFAYDGFGRSTSAASGYPFRYTGQRLDPETGLMFYKARVYSTNLGRFLQTDPIGTKDDLNLYQYAGNDGVNRTDPTGMESPCISMNTGCGMQNFGNVSLDDFQTRLDYAGLVPGLGEPADGLNGIIYAARGRYVEAGLSLGAMVPVFGWGATVVKGGMKYGDDAVEFAAARLERHHPIPKFLGGNTVQDLGEINSILHQDVLHPLLARNLREAGFPLNARNAPTRDWEDFFAANPGSQSRAFDVLLDTSRAVDQQYGGNITQDVWGNIMEGNYRSYP